MSTEKQIVANRQNAQKSTGAKTEDGKAIVKLNAVKHGILSDAVVIPKGEGQERKEAYLRLYNGLWDYFKPDGAMEDALVEQIAVTLWRKRRVLRFELGCLRKQLDRYTEDYEGSNAHGLNAQQGLSNARRDAAFAQECIAALQGGVDILSDEGAEEWAEDYAKLAAQDYFSRTKSENEEDADGPALRDWLKEQGLTDEALRNGLIAIHQTALKDAQEKIKPLEAQAALELEQAALLASLPEDEADLDKIIRYEASLDRQLYKAINQLERLQRRRKGEDLPAPVVLDET